MSAHPQPRTDATGIIDEHLDREQAKARASSQTAYDRLRALTRGAKGDRPDYGNFISCADATAIVEEIDRLRAGSASPASSDVPTTEAPDLTPLANAMGLTLIPASSGIRPASLSYVTPSELIERARASIAEDTGTRDAAECTGVAARWCPIHGNCTDTQREQDPDAPDFGPPDYADHCNDRECPLHGAKSTHGTASPAVDAGTTDAEPR